MDRNERTGSAAAATMAAGERELIVTRQFDAPRELVFDAWTDPEHLPKWWGPDGFTATIQQMDVRPGGELRLIMHGPDGRDYHNRFVYIDVARPERLIYRHAPEAGTEPVDFVTTVTFDDTNGRTMLTMRMVFSSPAALRHVLETYHADEGAVQTLGRLARHVAAVVAERARR